MFAIPFNFVEDFFIVASIGRSLHSDGRVATASRRVWLVTGIAWCALQIGSLLPGSVGVASGTLALLVWAANWAHTALLSRRLREAAVPAARSSQVV